MRFPMIPYRRSVAGTGVRASKKRPPLDDGWMQPEAEDGN
jgi:hypothetical protein